MQSAILLSNKREKKKQNVANLSSTTPERWRLLVRIFLSSDKNKKKSYLLWKLEILFITYIMFTCIAHIS